MSETADSAAGKTGKKSRILIPIIATVILGGAGFASTFLGYWSPADLFQATPTKAAERLAFLDIPPVEISVPGGSRSVILTASLELAEADRGAVEKLMPRILDTMNGFLTEIDAAAYDKRGVLEIIRAELSTRIGTVLGDIPFRDLLITEFRIK
ncbi:flagellar FliL protein [Paracoccus alcaliphilus]|uniref:Flagellar protein FliL n=1 Tax=Paracoccus alcaliphilus TaxID=34002 RepID=A0A1H8I6N7_9RHOB|nr:flagellar basal body-associated FliL family protein [Paracoccus alcaliphilus]WCR19494.1 flagellar basal body protein FliL [Paracoccus alcaliphilus]SEN63736.1 flagellar FliL protein [Paracoccus alcaliphilus]